MYYLWLVQPFWQSIKGAVTGATTTTSPHLWTKKVALTALDRLTMEVWSTDALSQGLASLFGDNKMNVRIYRHVIVAISRRFLKENWGNKTEEDEMIEEFEDGAYIYYFYNF